MTTVRVASRQRERFTIVDRRTVNDSRLSFRARGLLVWLLDKPDDWRISAVNIARETTEGRDAMYAALAELEKTGYLIRRRVQAEGGKWRTDSEIHEVPPHVTDDGFPGIGEPVIGEPVIGKPGVLLKTENQKTETEENPSQSYLQRDRKTAEPRPRSKTVKSRTGPERDHAERQRGERNRNVDPKTQRARDWLAVVAHARSGQHLYSTYDDISPIGRAAASRLGATLRMESETSAKIAYREAWDELAEAGVLG